MCVKFSLAGFALALFYGWITIPTGYAMGSNGGPFAMILSVMILLGVVYVFKKTNIDLEIIALLFTDYAFIIILVVLAVVGAISYMLSVHCYTKTHS